MGLGGDTEGLQKSQKETLPLSKGVGASQRLERPQPLTGGQVGLPPQLDLLKEAGQSSLPRKSRITERSYKLEVVAVRKAHQVFLGRIGGMQSLECLDTGGKS